MAIYSIMRERLSIHLYLSVYHLFISYTSIIYHLSSTQYLSSIFHLLSIYPLFIYLLSIINLFIYHLDGQLSSVTLIYYLSPICPSTIIYLSYIYFLLQKAFNVDKDIPPKKKKNLSFLDCSGISSSHLKLMLPVLYFAWKLIYS